MSITVDENGSIIRKPDDLEMHIIFNNKKKRENRKSIILQI